VGGLGVRIDQHGDTRQRSNARVDHHHVGAERPAGAARPQPWPANHFSTGCTPIPKATLRRARGEFERAWLDIGPRNGSGQVGERRCRIAAPTTVELLPVGMAAECSGPRSCAYSSLSGKGDPDPTHLRFVSCESAPSPVTS
jgi:hypothetical protein